MENNGLLIHSFLVTLGCRHTITWRTWRTISVFIQTMDGLGREYSWYTGQGVAKKDWSSTSLSLVRQNSGDSWWRHQTGVSKRWSMNCNFSVTFIKSLKQSSTKSCPIVHLVAVWTLIYLICKKVIVKLVVQGLTGSRTTESTLLSTAVICISITDAMKSLCSIELEILASCAES